MIAFNFAQKRKLITLLFLCRKDSTLLEAFPSIIIIIEPFRNIFEISRPPPMWGIYGTAREKLVGGASSADEGSECAEGVGL